MSGQFSQSIAKWNTKTNKRIEQVYRGVCLKLFSAVILDTPVGSDYHDEHGRLIKHIGGRLRANWQCSVKEPDRTSTTNLDQTGGPTISKMKQVVATVSPTTEVFLTNSLPYAHRIEYDGWSHTKAPEGMVRKNVARFNGIVSELAAQQRNT